MAAVGCLFCLLMLATWLGCRIEATRERRRNCVHQWGEPAFFAGYGTRHCRLCGAQEPWTPPRGDDDDGD